MYLCLTGLRPYWQEVDITETLQIVFFIVVRIKDWFFIKQRKKANTTDKFASTTDSNKSSQVHCNEPGTSPAGEGLTSMSA